MRCTWDEHASAMAGDPPAPSPPRAIATFDEGLDVKRPRSFNVDARAMVSEMVN